MICTGIPNRCQCQGRCPMAASKARGDRVVPMNEAARKQADANGDQYDRKESAALERFFGCDEL